MLVATPLKFMLTGSDLTQSASAEVTVTVLNSIDEKPFADAGPAQMVSSGQAVTLSGSGTDPNGDPIVSYAWQQLTGPAASLSSGSVASPSFTAPIVAVGTVLRFQLAVSDGTLASDPAEVPITVMPVVATMDGGADAGTDAGPDAGVLDGGEGVLDGGPDGGSPDAGSADAGAGLVADAGSAPADLDGGVATARVLGVGCGCTQAPPVVWLLALAWWLRRRTPRAR